MGDWEGFVGSIVIGSISTPCYKKRILGSKRPKNSPFLVAGGASGKVASKSRHQCKKASEIIPAETAMVEDAVLVRLQKVGACRWWPSNRWQITTQLRQILGVSNVRTLENIKQMQVVGGKPLTFNTTLYLSFILHSLHQSLKQIGRKYFNGQYKILRVFCVGYRKEVGFT